MTACRFCGDHVPEHQPFAGKTVTYVTKGNGCSSESEDEEASVTHPTTVWFGQLAYSAGACHNCRPATAAAPQ